MSASYWLHILGQLAWGFGHIHCHAALLHYYLRHHALGFLHSGITSGSGGRSYLRWLVYRNVGPVDW